MGVQGVTSYALSAYVTVSSWVYDNPVGTDIIIVSAVAGSLVFLARKTLRMRRLAHRIRWGAGMKRSKNRECFEKGLISFGICDAIEEAIWRGDMTRDRANQWYESFATDYNMTELLPRKMDKREAEEQLKKDINRRLMFWEKLKVVLPGMHPKDEQKVDKTYQPTNVVTLVKGRTKSKYSKAS